MSGGPDLDGEVLSPDRAVERERALAVAALAAGESGTEARLADPWLPAVLRAAALAVGAAVIAIPLAGPAVVGAAAFGAFVGALLARPLVRSGLRALGVCVVVLVAGLVVAAVHHTLGGALGARVAAALGGAEAALFAADLWLFGAGALVLTAALRALSMRVAAARALELLVVGLGFAELFRAHRHGAINRPFEFADPILTRGGDPTQFVALIGGAALVVSVFYLLSERSVRRALLDLAVVLALMSLGGFYVYAAGPRLMSEVDDPLNLKGKGKEGGGDDAGDKDKKNSPNEELEFKDKYERPDTPAPLAVVLFHSEYSSPTGLYYFRQSAFSQWNGTRLVQTARADLDRDVADGFPLEPTTVREPPPEEGARMPVETTVGMLQDHTRPFGLEAPVRFSPWQNPNPRRFPRTYRVASLAIDDDLVRFVGMPVGAAKWGEAERAHYTEGPADPRYRELALEIIDEVLPPSLRADPVAQTAAITGWLGEKGVYSLRSKHADAPDPTADFLFGDRTGYCVHFAHAAAFLLRSVGVPTRIAAGYMAPEQNRRGGSGLVVTGADSHAWPEIYIDGLGWVVADVAPQTVLSPPPPAPDPDLQRLLADFLRGQAPLAEDLKPREALGSMARRYWAYARAAGLGLLGFVLLGLWLGKLLRRVAPWLLSAGALPRTAYVAGLDVLSDVGERRREGETREAFAERLSARFPALTTLTALHLRAAFGPRPAASPALAPASPPAAPSPPASEYRAALRALRRDVRGRVPLHRRMVGALNPWTWLQSR